MMEDFIYCKDLYKLIRLKEKPYMTRLMRIGMWNIENPLLV